MNSNRITITCVPILLSLYVGAPVALAFTRIDKYSSLSLAQIAMVQIKNVYTVSEDDSNRISGFYALLRDCDLNRDTENGHAITQTEYDTLLTLWKALPPYDRIQIMNEPSKTYYYWRDSFVMNLIGDLNNGVAWDAHVKRMVRLKTRGLSLTLTRFNTSVTVKAARELLVDLLHRGASMVNGGRLEISEDIKMQAEKRLGSMAWRRLKDWEQLINDHQNDSEADKLAAVNQFFNQNIAAQNDGKWRDYWQSPIETLVRGIGDCEDFAMAKYVSLRLLGIPLEQLRIAVVESPNYNGMGHAVVFFYPLNENDPWVLDNEASSDGSFIESHIQRLSKRVKLDKMKPLAGINESFLASFQGSRSDKLPEWEVNHLLAKFITALINSQRLLPRRKV